ncbi:MAG TPA: hypothetical protein VM784_15075 [Actinomycetota bacterium]|nr:hypothetical protein [Actinomycetota bacterium]
MSRRVLSGIRSVPDVLASIAHGINSDWAIPMPRASALANDVFRFWEEQAGVFAVSEDVVVPRTKLLAEVGDAVWASGRSDAEVDAWLYEALPELDRHEAVKLAAALAPGIADALIAASAGSGVSLLVASDAVLEGASPSEASLARLVDMLVEAAANPPEDHAAAPKSTLGIARLSQSRAEARAEMEGPAWKYLARLGRLPLPAHLRARRDRALREIEQPQREAVLRGLTAAADIRTDDRLPTEEEQGHLRALVNLPLPEDDHRVEHVSRRRMVIHGGSSGLLSGHIEALEAAIPLITLGRDEAKRVLAAGQRSSMGAASRIHRALTEAGHHEVVTEHYRERWPNIPVFDLQSGWAEFLDLLATSWNPSDISRSQRWRLENIGELVEELGLGNLGVGEFEVAVSRRPDLVEIIARVTATALGLDLRTVAAEAVAVRPLVNVGLNDAARLLFVPPPPRRDQDDLTLQLTDAEREQLRKALVSRSDWLFNVSVGWLSQDGASKSRELLRASLESLVAPHRLALAKYLARVADNAEEMGALWLAGSDDILRIAAAYVIGREGTHRDQLEPLLNDDDLTVRSYARAGLKATGEDRNLLSELAATSIAQFWCCTHCEVRQQVDSIDCQSCSTGTRPEATSGDTP